MRNAILLIEDELLILNLYLFELREFLPEDQFKIFLAHSAQEARTWFNANAQSIAIVSFDGILMKQGSREVESLGVELVREFLKFKHGDTVFIAASSSPDHNLDMMNTGCTSLCPSKRDLSKLIVQHLGLR